MTLEYTAVSDMWHIWHILRMYHRVTMWSMSSEAIAEHVGSLIRYVEKKQCACRALDVLALVRAARLRAAGLRGDNRDAPFYHASNVAPFSEAGRCAFFVTTPAEGYLCRDVGPIPDNFKDPREDHCRPRWP